MDATYLQATIGPLLATGLAEVTAVRPADPVDYLAQYLLKSTEAGKEGRRSQKPRQWRPGRRS